MSPNDITIMHVTLTNGKKGRCYYYQGNFYYPLERLGNNMRAKMRIKINVFKHENAALIKADRAHPDYKTLLQIFDEQFGEVATCK